MTNFIEIPANNQSKAQRKPVFGVGVNDALYMVCPTINGKKIMCCYYRKWVSMLERCYDSKLHLKRPTYIGCSVCSEWLIFTNFKRWMINQDWIGKDLDKDIKVKGNKIYSPDTCLFVLREINSLLNDCGSRRGIHPKGVSFHKQHKKFVAQIDIKGKIKHLGYYDTPKLAEISYILSKNEDIIRQGRLLKNNYIKRYLNQHIIDVNIGVCL